jgi:hypothetical protein
MPQVPTSPDNQVSTKTTPTGKPLLVPPEEQFWKRYSPHHEFPLSSATSIALHIIAIGLLLLIAILFWNIKKESSDVPELIPVVAETGSDTKGEQTGGGRSGGNRGDDTESLPDEGVDDPDAKEEGGDAKAPALMDPEGDPAVEIPSDPGATRRIVQGTVTKKLTDVGKKALVVLAQRNVPKTQKGSKDKGGGSGGDKGKGRDKGKDKGTGSKKGPKRGELEQKIVREKRQLRWRILFNTRSGSDYQNQLYALKATLVVAEFQPGSRTNLQYRLVLRGKEVASNRARPRVEDVRKIKGIFWIDDKPESVHSLASALGLRPPPLFACFFPIDVELHLRELEKAKYPGDENDINETIFRLVESRNGGYRGAGTSYNLVCDEVILKR